MNLSDDELDMLISGCVHYRNVYADLGNKSAVARKRKQAFIDLRDKLTAYKDDRHRYFDDEINGSFYYNKKNLRRIACEIYGKKINNPKEHPGYDDDCHI